jgi:hypothetical protein
VSRRNLAGGCTRQRAPRRFQAGTRIRPEKQLLAVLSAREPTVTERISDTPAELLAEIDAAGPAIPMTVAGRSQRAPPEEGRVGTARGRSREG